MSKKKKETPEEVALRKATKLAYRATEGKKDKPKDLADWAKTAEAKKLIDEQLAEMAKAVA